MNFIIFIISIIGIMCICFTVNNVKYINCDCIEKKENRLEIVLTCYNVDNVKKDDVISDILTGNYNDILDIVDNIRINWL